MRAQYEGNTEGRVSNIEDAMVFNTGGGRNSTVTKRVWHIFETTNHTQIIRGYGNEGEGKHVG
eukprot:6341728-Ditylum_brightwellii.AAC.1